MGDEARELEALEHILIDASMKPTRISYTVLESITENFSHVIGRGGFGVVYLGILQNGKIAVKKLSVTSDFSDDIFEDEVSCLMRTKHKNIVRFLGYCADAQGELMEIKGKYRIVHSLQRLLCFEYVPKGNLRRFLEENSHGDKWKMRYEIIKGICQGLHYLHLERINHLDLKPQNVLLDDHMEPKITDFGLSRCFNEKQSRIFTKNLRGTPGYIAPEYIDNREISFKSDIFSLGIILIQLLTGNWQQSMDVDCPQMKRCIEIAQICVDRDQHNRPTIGEIIRMLNEAETMIHKVPAVISESTNDPGSSVYQASSSVSKLVDEVRSMAVSAASSHSQLQQIMSVPKEPGETSTEPFKDGLIKDESNATSNVGTEYNLNLYMHQTIHGPNHNQINIADPKQPLMFGYTNVHDYPIHDSLGPSAKIVARAQGLHAETSMNDDDWFHWSSIVFIDERFRGSSFKAIGNQNKIEGEWAIVGGTGVFTFAQGTISIYRIQDNGPSNIKEIRINAFCYTPPEATAAETKPFKDRLLKDESNAASNVGSLSMANAQSGPVTPQSQGTEYSLNLYMHQIIHGPNHNQINIADPKQPLMFGYTNVHDYPIHDSLGPSAKIVARAQGLHAETSMNDDDWFHWSSIVFIDERFRGSSFKAIGNQNKIEGEWAIVGGTGVFTFAQGTISIYRIQDNGPSNTKEIRIRAFCRTPQTTPTKTKPFKDGLIKDESNATSNVGTEYNLNLYMYQTIHGPNRNQINIADPKQPLMFGYTNVHDYPIHDSLGPSAKIVARAQGLHSETSMSDDDWFHWSSIVFIDERFRGSSFKAIGNQNKIEGEWAIVGGTGVFTFAQGTISIYRIQDNGPSNTKEIRIRAFCRTPQTTPTKTKVLPRRRR